MNRYCVVLAMCLSISTGLLISVASGYQSGSSGGVAINFKPDAILGTPEFLDSTSILIPQLRAFLQANTISGEKMFKTVSAADTQGVSRTGQTVKLIDLSRWYRFTISDSAYIAWLLDTVRKIQGVEAASPMRSGSPNVIDGPNDPEYQVGRQWGLYNPLDQSHDIDILDAWEINKGRSDVIVAVIERTGFQVNHPDLDPGDRSRLIQGWNSSGGTDVMDYGNDSKSGHGTGVAGVIGAITDNGQGIAGIMQNCKILPLKYDSHFSEAGNAILEAVNRGAHIINMSFSGDPDEVDLYFQQCVVNAYNLGVILVSSMGNDDGNYNLQPAFFPQVTAVGATDRLDDRARWGTEASTIGNHINMVAPGKEYASLDILSHAPGLQLFGGTSCAAPIVSGVAGLVLSQAFDRGFSLTNDDVISLMDVTADDLGDHGWDEIFGWGRVNAGNALKRLEYPYDIEHATLSAPTLQLLQGSHAHTFFGAQNLNDGTYYGVRTYRATWHVTFSKSYVEPPLIWHESRSALGWANESPVYAKVYAHPYTEVTNLTTSGCDISTNVFWVASDAGGTVVNKYYPFGSSTIPAVRYTVNGREAISAPTGFVLDALTATQVQIRWNDNSNNEKGFTVERSTDGTNYVSVGKLITNGPGTGVRTMTDNVAGSTTYYYRLRGFAQTFETSNVTGSITLANLTAPTGLSALNAPMNVKLSWSAVPGSQGYKIFKNGVEVLNTSLTSCWIPVTVANQNNTFEIRPYIGSYLGAGSQINGYGIHMASYSQTVTGSSNQRRIVSFPGYVCSGYPAGDPPPSQVAEIGHYMVYESNGDIFCTFSFAGGGWAAEELISDGLGHSSNPSIEYFDVAPNSCIGPNKLFVVWEQNPYNGGYQVNARTKVLDGVSSWGPIDHIYTDQSAGPPSSTPVISGQWIFWRAALGLKVKKIDGGTAYDIPGTDASSAYPSADVDGVGTVVTMSVVWDQLLSGIRYLRGTSNSGAPSWTSQFVPIENNVGSAIFAKPTVAMDYNYKAYVAWQRSDGSGSIQLRTVSTSNSLTPIIVLSTCGATENLPSGPMLGHHRWDITRHNDMTLTWRVDGTTPPKTVAAYYTNSSGAWSAPFVTPSTGKLSSQSLPTFRTGSGLDPVMISTSVSGPPYSIIPYSLPGVVLQPGSPSLVAPGINASGVSTSPLLSWECTMWGVTYQLQVDNNADCLSPLFDQSNLTNTYQSIQNLSYGTTYYWRVRATNANGTGVYSSTRSFTTAGGTPPSAPALSGTIYNTHPRLTWNSVGTGITYKLYKYTCEGHTDCELNGWLQYQGTQTTFDDGGIVVGNKLDPGMAWYYVVATSTGGSSPHSNLKSYYVDGFSEETKTQIGEVPEEKLLPDVYSLSPNYPNPFNPTTKIAYALPEPAYVMLTIYNTYGETVSTLVNETQGPGFKEVEFNASAIPSGIYFYRIKAGSFTDVKKMILIK